MDLKALEARRETLKMSLRTLRSDLQNPARLQKQIDDDNAEIARIKQRIVSTQTRLSGLKELFTATSDELAEVNSKLKLESKSVKIKTLKKLASSIAIAVNSELSGPMSIEDIEAAILARRESNDNV